MHARALRMRQCWCPHATGGVPGMGIRVLVLPEWSAWAWVGVNHWDELAALAFYEVNGGAMIVHVASRRALYKLFQRSGPSHPCSTPSDYSRLVRHIAYLDVHTWVAHSSPHAPTLHCTLPPPNRDDEPTSPPIGSLNGTHFDCRILFSSLWKIFIRHPEPVACPHEYAVGCEPRHWERHEGCAKFMSSRFCVAGCFGKFRSTLTLLPNCLYLTHRIARPHVPAPNYDAPRTPPTSYPCRAVTSPNNDREKRHYNDDAVVAQLGLDRIL
ncbi:hypothetical protein BD779DRAFT_1479772 [Infundibulicybe gibba]|nr:hypothetical protein BD779DRAFT_1479772 [Infundibulicybe gibba]